MDARAYWDNIYHSKTPEQLSWTQAVPVTSLALIDSFGLSPDARIIDIGGGESRLAWFLLERGFRNITVLDISAEAIKRAQVRLGDRAALVKWIVADVTGFEPGEPYDVWHDRATFHFLTTPREVSGYLGHARAALPAGGYLLIGTFSDNGPGKCSGLPVRQYNEKSLTQELDNGFDKIRCVTEDHETPFHTTQHFLFCSFKRG
jgi:cyclopropane fatty-acyl-phospholipid synthase-like methyltransferase